MKPAPFTYHRARSAEDAARLLAELGDEAKLLAGGQSLIAMMNYRLARPRHLVDIGSLPESEGLTGFRHGPDGLRIGALTTHHAVETADEAQLGAGFAVLRDAMRWVGHLPIRTRGTVGGSIAHGDSTAEWCLLAVLLDARIVARGPRGTRTITAGDFFYGFFSTALEPDELITELVFPHPAPHAALTEFAERKGDFGIVVAAVDLDVENGAVRGGRVALGGVAPAPVQVPEAEEALARGGSEDVLFAACAEAAAAAIDPPGDGNGTAQYRRILTRRLVIQACEEAMSR
ncbi:FAD binding domain-containing protein [Streptomyces sp. NBC_00440]|uniref:FAD binding domain-containing protein n=1 Tax=Streptomyces sp. NBC_00440 TaxID=2975741 RepID=UPI002E1A18DD